MEDFWKHSNTEDELKNKYDLKNAALKTSQKIPKLGATNEEKKDKSKNHRKCFCLSVLFLTNTF